MFALAADPTIAELESPGLEPADVERLAEGVISWQGSLFGLDEPAIDPSFAGHTRTWLADGCWVDHVPAWVSGSDTMFAELVARLPWRQRRVPMYGRMVDEPRLTAWWSADGGEPVPFGALDDVGRALASRYDVAFDSIGFNLYRDGADSVAWHTDRNGRGVPDTTIATVSVGAPRPFLLRPIGGGRSLPFLLGQGDLLVMGGETQLEFEHAVPKVAAAGPRLSIGFRHLADRPSSLLSWADAESVRRHPASARDRHSARANPAHGFAKVLGEGSGATGTWPGRR